MGLFDSLAEKVGTKYIIKSLITLKAYCDGKKTYVGGVIGIVGGIAGYLSGQLDGQIAAGGIWMGFMMIFRAAATNKLTQSLPVAAPDPNKP